MREQGERLPKSVDIRSYNRPVKVAFIIPVEENKTNHWILDGIFYEAYTRWGGAHSLIIPFKNGQFEDDRYLDWLVAFDPDFIYSYVDLDEALIENINRQTMPIEMIRHKLYSEADRWRAFIPTWPHGVEPVRSISTLTSPNASYSFFSSKQTPQIYITQFFENDEERFLPDNFGIAHDTATATHGYSGVYETMCYCDNGLPENHIVGNYRIYDLSDVMKKLSKKELRTFSQLARIHSDGINHPKDNMWGQTFHVFVGDTVNDRLHYWNSKHLSSNHDSNSFNSLIVSKELILDDQFCYQLGQFLNNFNFNSGGGGPARVHIRSLSLSKSECESFVTKIAPLTWSSVSVPDNFSSFALQSADSFENYYISSGTICASFKANEYSHSYVAPEPEHFQFITSNFMHAKKGQWAVELLIERHVSNCQYINSFDDWKLPLRYEVVKAFTNNIGKVNNAFNLVVLPMLTERQGFNSNNHDKKINLNFPDDDTVFRYLVIDDSRNKFSDMRACLNRGNKYKDIRISDKGQYHRGVVSLFDNDPRRASVLTNIFWRNFIRDSHASTSESGALYKFLSTVNDLSDDELKVLVEKIPVELNASDGKADFIKQFVSSLNELSQRDLKRLVEVMQFGSYSEAGKSYSMKNICDMISRIPDSDLTSLVEQMRFEKPAVAKTYLKNNVIDVVESFVHNGVLQQLHSWRCEDCGNKNMRSLDTLKRNNTCDVCNKSYQTPIDMSWQYSISPFVMKSLSEQNGLTVLWGISELLDMARSHQSIYFPEVDLYRVYGDQDQKNEIDILALIDGKFVVAEVKLSAVSLIYDEKQADTFVDEIERLRPDIAYLIFEQYCRDEEKNNDYKIELNKLVEKLRLELPPNTELKVIVASETAEFLTYPHELGSAGRRTHKSLDNLDN